MPVHIRRLLVLLISFFALAVFAKSFFTADTFYEYGHFRAASVPEIAKQVPVFQTPVYCKSCHAQRYALWSANGHKTVICEVCHGQAKDHPQQRKLPIPSDTAKLCGLCHESMPGRPAAQPQVDIQAHSAGQQCIVCHNPHSPKLAVAPNTADMAKGDAARGKPLASQCSACHGEQGISINVIWPNLAGQNAAYLVDALKAFKAGSRVDAMMNPIAQSLDAQAIDDLGAYYSGLAGPECDTEAAGSGKADAGKALAVVCVNCHGANGLSSQGIWPSLAGQKSAYIAKVLTAFKTGERSNAMMNPIAKNLSDSDIQVLAQYYANLQCRPSP